MPLAEDPRPPDTAATAARAVPTDEHPPPPDAGEPMGSRDPDRPSMLGRRFRQTLAAGMLVGLILALAGNALISQLWLGRDANAASWVLAAIGGLAVGGALTLFIYGVSTDRTDSGAKPRGRADVTTEGEEHREQRRRRRGFGRSTGTSSK
ncbi:MAG: hypothetical protein QOK36_4176 [Gaiellales bacterium]|jgi:hypothetical protein|nr:hypothetical protein [Gaiellales bacterium]